MVATWSSGGLFGFANPHLLDGFQDFLAAAGWVVVKIGQRQDQIAQLGKAQRFRVDAVAVRVEQFFADALGVGPFHGVSLLMV